MQHAFTAVSTQNISWLSYVIFARSRVMRCGAHIFALALGGCWLAGCTTGNRWVEAPENGPACTAEFCADGGHDTWVAVVDSGTKNPSAHERVDRVISLGAVYDDRKNAATPAAANSEPEPSEYSSGYDLYDDAGYGGWYGGWGWGWGRRARGPSVGRFSLNRFGSRVPNFGPPFPFRTAPASPWSPAGPSMVVRGLKSHRR